MKTKLLFTVLAFIAVTTIVSAQNNGAGQKQAKLNAKGSAWVDSNNDGVCDNLSANKSACPRGAGQGAFRGAGQARRQGMGPCGTGQGQGKQRNFVDADKNGVCDNRETHAKK